MAKIEFSPVAIETMIDTALVNAGVDMTFKEMAERARLTQEVPIERLEEIMKAEKRKKQYSNFLTRAFKVIVLKFKIHDQKLKTNAKCVESDDCDDCSYLVRVDGSCLGVKLRDKYEKELQHVNKISNDRRASRRKHKITKTK